MITSSAPMPPISEKIMHHANPIKSVRINGIGSGSSIILRICFISVGLVVPVFLLRLSQALIQPGRYAQELT